jgi:flagellar biosynthesis/type III secretory pathway protein FliH
MIFEATVPMQKKLKGVALVEPASSWTPRELSSGAAPEPSMAVLRSGVARSNREEAEILERLQENLDELSQELWEQQRQRLAEMQRVAVELAVAIASRLLHQRIEQGDLAVENLVRQVAERLEPQEALTVYLHPTDLALLQQQGQDAQDWHPNEGKLKLVGDPSLCRGDCRAETGDMSLLLSLDKQLEEVRKHLLNVLPDADVEQRNNLTGDRQLRRYPERRHTA